MQKERYVNPFTDFGFKKIFGEEPNKDLLIDFLNELLKEQEGKIVDLTYLKSEHLGSNLADRKAIFDLYCQNERGEKFIVELQKTKQKFFKDRSIYYATFPIREQAVQSDWNFELKAVYLVGILDFIFDEDKSEPNKYRYDVKLTEQETQKVFYDKLTLIYLEMPKFKKNVDELSSRFEKWMYVLRNLNRLERVPERLRERIFEKLFEVSEIAMFTPDENRTYEDSLKVYRDLKNSIDTAVEKGIAIGLEKGLKKGMKKGKIEGMRQKQTEFVKNSIAAGISTEIISQITGLSAEEIEEIGRVIN